MAATAENEAYDRVVKWVGIDPFYAESPILTPREQALVRLAIRCLWSGRLVDDAINRAVAEAITREVLGNGGDRDPA